MRHESKAVDALVGNGAAPEAIEWLICDQIAASQVAKKVNEAYKNATPVKIGKAIEILNLDDDYQSPERDVWKNRFEICQEFNKRSPAWGSGLSFVNLAGRSKRISRMVMYAVRLHTQFPQNTKPDFRYVQKTFGEAGFLMGTYRHLELIGKEGADRLQEKLGRRFKPIVALGTSVHAYRILDPRYHDSSHEELRYTPMLCAKKTKLILGAMYGIPDDMRSYWFLAIKDR